MAVISTPDLGALLAHQFRGGKIAHVSNLHEPCNILDVSVRYTSIVL